MDQSGGSTRTGAPGTGAGTSAAERQQTGPTPPAATPPNQQSGGGRQTPGSSGYEMGSKVADRAQETVGNVVSEAKEQASARLSDQMSRAAHSISAVADATRSVGKQLREQDQRPLAQYADQAADQVERVAHYFEGKDLDQVLRDTERLARRQPVAFIGGAFALGLLAARFLKSSGDQARMGDGTYYDQYPMRGMDRSPYAGGQAARSGTGSGMTGQYPTGTGQRTASMEATGQPSSTGVAGSSGAGTPGSRTPGQGTSGTGTSNTGTTGTGMPGSGTTGTETQRNRST